MTRLGYRIVKASRAKHAFTGEGAKRHGGRWNSPGVRMVYTASSISLAMLEMLVHLGSDGLLLRYVVIPITFNEKLITVADPKHLPKDWDASPASPAVQHVGDTWAAAQRSAVLQVPSVIVKSEPNYLLNPAHPDYSKIKKGKPQPILFDPRFKSM